jgi:hypothetical protein
MQLHPPRLRRRLSTAAFAVLLISLCAAADQPPDIRYGPRPLWTLGVMLGGPTGLMIEGNLRSGNAWDLGLGAIMGPGARIHGDYLWTIAGSDPDAELFVRLQIGLGAMVGILTHPCTFYGDFQNCNRDGYIGARLPIALEFWPRGPINFGFEVAPGAAGSLHAVTGLLDAFAFVRLNL